MVMFDPLLAGTRTPTQWNRAGTAGRAGQRRYMAAQHWSEGSKAQWMSWVGGHSAVLLTSSCFIPGSRHSQVMHQAVRQLAQQFRTAAIAKRLPHPRLHTWWGGGCWWCVGDLDDVPGAYNDACTCACRHGCSTGAHICAR